MRQEVMHLSEEWSSVHNGVFTVQELFLFGRVFVLALKLKFPTDFDTQLAIRICLDYFVVISITVFYFGYI